MMKNNQSICGANIYKGRGNCGPRQRYSRCGLSGSACRSDQKAKLLAAQLRRFSVFASLRDRILRFLADDFLVAYTLLLIALMGIGGAYAKFQFSVGA